MTKMVLITSTPTASQKTIQTKASMLYKGLPQFPSPNDSLQVGGRILRETRIAWLKREGGWMVQEFRPCRGQALSRPALKNCGPPRRKIRFENPCSIAFSSIQICCSA